MGYEPPTVTGGDRERTRTATHPAFPIPLLPLVLVIMLAVWSVIRPHDYLTWLLEAFPVLLALPLLALTYRRFRLTDLAYVLIAIHCAVLLIGAHYTYAEVPAFHWIQEQFSLSRNHYDRVGHFAQGFVPAIIARELLLRTSPLRAGKWLFAIVILSCLGISALYELLEWAVAGLTGTAADAFLGMQGDLWDTQKDMAFALVGTLSALILLGRWHDTQLQGRDKTGKIT